ncbi:MAG TPA: TetR/AcrR family transcriptional regulator [Desulfobacterales bacterium]|nr:TetR/AcrR family transcriptional regulator [Desulfobacterales bacterium]
MGIQTRQLRDRERRRQQIIAASKRVFTSKGVSRTTIKDIADEAELSPGTLYIYFKNKDELYASLSIRMLKHLQLSLQRVKETKNLSDDQRIDSVKKALLELYEIDPLMLINLSHLQASETLDNISPELYEQILDLSRRSLQTLSEIFAEGIELGSFLKRKPMQLAVVLWAMFSGLVLWEESKRSLDSRKAFLKPTLDVAFDIFGRGIVKRDSD